MRHPARIVCVTALLVMTATAAFAQSTGLEQGGGMAWGSLGFQGDLGGAVNRSGIGVVNGLRAEIDTNTWAERYDAALIFRFGGAYNLTQTSQLFGAITWEQSESDTTTVGLIGGQPLQATFSDYQGTGFDFGYRFVFPTELNVNPFVAASIGFQRLQNITISLSSPVYTNNEIPFYDDSWVAGWRVGTGVLMDFTNRLGGLLTIDLRYSGVLSDQSGIGSVGFERINDVGNRWTLPIMAGVYVKF